MEIMEWTKASLVGMDLFNMAHVLKFSKNIFEEVFCVAHLALNDQNSFDHYNSYNRSPNLAFFCFIKGPSNSILTIKFPKNHITSSYHTNMFKIAMAKIWPLLSFRGYNSQNHIYDSLNTP
jgi:hypothetical protein